MASLWEKAGRRWVNSDFATTNGVADTLRNLGVSDENLPQQVKPTAVNMAVQEAINFMPTGSIASGIDYGRMASPPEPRPAWASQYADYVPLELVMRESSGRWDAENKDRKGNRYVGQLQFGEARLADAMRAGVLPQGTTLDQFKASQPLQVAVGNWHIKNLMDRINSSGASQYIGTKLQGSDAPLTMNSLVAMAHLGGFNGMLKTLQTGGKSNPNDGHMSMVRYAELNR